MSNRAGRSLSRVDTSGSMGGFNEQCAKAFCLALMRIALADNRRCFIMLFSQRSGALRVDRRERTGAGDPFPETAFSRRHRSGQLFSRHY